MLHVVAGENVGLREHFHDLIIDSVLLANLASLAENPDEVVEIVQVSKPEAIAVCGLSVCYRNLAIFLPVKIVSDEIISGHVLACT
jgi:hypothetical protein